MSIFAKESTGEAVLSNPLFTKSFSKAVVKSDKEDARKLANLKRAEFPETVWHPNADTLRLRHFVNDRESRPFVTDRFLRSPKLATQPFFTRREHADIEKRIRETPNKTEAGFLNEVLTKSTIREVASREQHSKFYRRG